MAEMKAKTLPLLLFGAILLLSCSEVVSPEYEAVLLPLDELQSTPGYSWFPLEMSLYEPDSQKVAAIAQAYIPGVHHFYFFVKPECQCEGTTKLFPRIVRILLDAHIPDTAMTIYSMRTERDKHPHQSMFHIQKLPTIYCTKSATIVGQISELPQNQMLEDIILSWVQK